jgi:hypothetical protein
MKKYGWLICKILFICLAILCFTPVVIPSGETSPSILGFPRTLWMGIGVSLCFIILTAFGAVYNNDSKTE